MKRSKHGIFVFPPKKPLTWRWHCSIGQSCCSMTSTRSVDWFLESSRAWNFFTRAFAYMQPTKSQVRLYPFNKPIKSLCFRSFVVSVLFACFHFKIIRKSLHSFELNRSYFCNASVDKIGSPFSVLVNGGLLFQKLCKLFEIWKQLENKAIQDLTWINTSVWNFAFADRVVKHEIVNVPSL